MSRDFHTTGAMIGAGIGAAGLVSVSTAAQFLSVSPSTLRRMIKEGELPTARIRGKWRLPRRALIEYADSAVNSSSR